MILTFGGLPRPFFTGASDIFACIQFTYKNEANTIVDILISVRDNKTKEMIF